MLIISSLLLVMVEFSDFFLFTDQPSIKKYQTQNLHWNFIDLKSLNELVKSNLEFKITIQNTYKIADFKPMYGLLFEKYLTERTQVLFLDKKKAL